MTTPQSPSRETTGAWAREVADVIGVKRLASLMGVRPTTVYTWLSKQRGPEYDTFRRLRILHQCSEAISEALGEPHATIQWLSATSPKLRATPAQTLLGYYPSVDTDKELLRDARAFVRQRSGPPHDDPNTRAAQVFISLVASSVLAGVLGDRKGDRVYLRPAEAAEHARRVAQAREAGPFDCSVNRISAGLVHLGAPTSGGKNSVTRKINGRVTRVWDVPLSLFKQGTPAAR